MLTHTLSLINSLQRFNSSHILLYHATFKDIPLNLKQNLHNVKPEEIYKQLSWYKKYFDVLSLDDYVKTRDKKGKMAVTFDDAYQSVFDEALPIFEELNIPFTVFVNGVSLQNRPFWRDKVRFLINKNLVEDFLASCNDFAKKHQINFQNFYKRTKHFEINSIQVDNLLDQYLNKKGIDLKKLVYCVNDKKQLIKHPLITYGNHTFNHYVLSSLSVEEQEQEIVINHTLLKSLDLPLSKVFSIPFGGKKDFNQTTFSLFKKYGYDYFLYSTNLFNFEQTGIGMNRYMLSSNFKHFQQQLFKIYTTQTLLPKK